MNTQRALSLAALLAFVMTVLPVHAATVPSNLLYEGRILDASRHPVTSPVVLRFSLWKSADWTAADVSGSAINLAANNFGGWYESQTIYPSGNGIIQAQLGSGTALPTLDFTKHKYLQVEVKSAGQPDTSYVLLDPTGDGGADAIDRRFVPAVAYAKNAESVQNRTVGTSSGDILLLGSGGKIDAARMGSGTNALGFTINAAGASGDATLTFGNTLLSQMLTFSSAHQRFEFSKDVYVSGALGVSGTLSGRTLHAQSLLTASGNSVFGGSARFNGTTILNGVTYTWPASAASASGKALKVNPATGQLSWSDDIDTGILQNPADSRYVNTSGDTMTGSLKVRGNLSGSTLNVDGVSTFNGIATHTANVKVRGNLSGTSLRIDGGADIWGTLSATGAIKTKSNLTINADSDTNDAVLTFGNQTIDRTIKFLNASQKFQFSKDVSVVGNLSGSTLNVDGVSTFNGVATHTANVKVRGNLSGSTLNVDGASTFNGIATHIANVKVRGNLSGSTLNVDGNATVQGSLTTKANLSGASLTVSGLKSCSTIVTDANGGLSCGGMVIKKKTTNQSVANSTALVEASTFQMGSNETWVYRFSLLMLAISATPDLSIAVTAPTGSTCHTQVADVDSAPTNNKQTSTCGTTISAITLGANLHTDLEVFGSITTAGTSGSGALRWAQSTANANATTMLSGSTLIAFKTVGSDLAEVYNTDDPSVLPGTVVSFDPRSPGWLTKSQSAYDSKVLGVISTKPGLTIGGDDLHAAKGIPVFLALAGRVPVMVSTENGHIKPGDLLTASSTPGVAMKATKAGPVIGKALSSYSGIGIGVVTVFIQNQSSVDQFGK